MHTCGIAVIYESKEVEKGSLVGATVAYRKGQVEETVRVLPVWTFNVVQQLHGGQNPDNAGSAWCSRTNTDLAGENVAQ